MHLQINTAISQGYRYYKKKINILIGSIRGATTRCSCYEKKTMRITEHGSILFSLNMFNFKIGLNQANSIVSINNCYFGNLLNSIESINPFGLQSNTNEVRQITA